MYGSLVQPQESSGNHSGSIRVSPALHKPYRDKPYQKDDHDHLLSSASGPSGVRALTLADGAFRSSRDPNESRAYCVLQPGRRWVRLVAAADARKLAAPSPCSQLNLNARPVQTDTRAAPESFALLRLLWFGPRYICGALRCVTGAGSATGAVRAVPCGC